MARPNAGQVTERPWKDGKTVTFGARLYAYGRRHRLVFGTNAQGWNRTRAEIELEDIQQQVDRGTWVPPEKKTTVTPTRAARPDGHQPFGPFAQASSTRSAATVSTPTPSRTLSGSSGI